MPRAKQTTGSVASTASVTLSALNGRGSQLMCLLPKTREMKIRDFKEGVRLARLKQEGRERKAEAAKKK
jgi:hypothetical protein